MSFTPPPLVPASKVPQSPTGAVLGKIGLPESARALAARSWDVIVVGAGHNGLTCAAYLARAGKRVLVLEARERVGGACTLDEPWPDVRVSPCAYVCGLLHPMVIDELGLVDKGFHWTPAAAGMFVPFDDGTSVQLWNDDDAAYEEVKRFAPGDADGWRAMMDVKSRLRRALRPAGPRDVWIGGSPSRAALEARLAGDDDARALLFEWSMSDCVERYLRDERLRMAYLGQGVIGTNASPTDPGTASVWYHHGSGAMFGHAGTWGYVTGGMGMVSFLLCDIAREAGAVVATGAPVARIIPGEGVELAGGEMIRASAVVSNADPRVTLNLLGAEADAIWRAQVERVPMKSVTVKVNLLLSELPNFRARPGTLEAHHFGQINTPLTKAEWVDGYAAATAGVMPTRVWTELYMHTAYDHSIAPIDRHTLTVFSQFVPNTFADGSWETRREEVGDLVVAALARHTSNIPRVIVGREVLGPPDVEKKVGLTGGHIFQGDILPPYMWDQRLSARTSMPGVFLCGAGTYPGGSVMGINGRNAAFELLRGD